MLGADAYFKLNGDIIAEGDLIDDHDTVTYIYDPSKNACNDTEIRSWLQFDTSHNNAIGFDIEFDRMTTTA